MSRPDTTLVTVLNWKHCLRPPQRRGPVVTTTPAPQRHPHPHPHPKLPPSPPHPTPAGR